MLAILDDLLDLEYFRRLASESYSPITILLEVLLIFAVVYAILRFLRGTRGARLMKSVGIIFLVSFLIVRVVAQAYHWDRVIFLYPYFVSGVFLTALVAFQPELRRGLMRLGEGSWNRWWGKPRIQIVEPVVAAAASLAKRRVGAVIAIERRIGLAGLIETGVRLDAEVSRDLLTSIFWPGATLHDMGVIIRQDRVAAARCQFPLAESGDIDGALGSRHRAALGLSQESDALIVVVSEETGVISVAERGRLHRFLTLEKLRERLIVGLGGNMGLESTEEPAELPTAERTHASEAAVVGHE